jgi:hypothetical protein
MLRSKSLGVLSASLVLAACAVEGEPASESSESNYTAGKFIQDNAPYYWADTSFEAFQTSNALTSGAADSVLPASDPLTVRLQALLDRVDAVVRAKTLKDGVRLVAPKPVAKIVVARNKFNAWVPGAVAGVGAPFGEQAPATGTLAYMTTDTVQGYTGAPGMALRALTIGSIDVQAIDIA